MENKKRSNRINRKNKKKVLDKAVPANRLNRAIRVMVIVFVLLTARLRVDTVCTRSRA